MHWYVRASRLVALARKRSYLFVVPDRPDPIVLDPVDVEMLARVLELTALPVPQAELTAACDEDAIELLVDLGVLVRCSEAEAARHATPFRAAAARKRCGNIVIGLSGAVGSFGALERIVTIADGFAETVDVVLTQATTHFLQPRLLEFYRLRTWLDPFQPTHGVAVPHEHLAMTTDLVLVAPATANTLHRLAVGACSDFISLVVAATAAPVVVVPSMNPQMWQHPPIRRNVQQLRDDGVWVVEPGLAFLVSARDQGGVGSGNVDTEGLLRALDVILPPAGAAQKPSAIRTSG